MDEAPLPHDTSSQEASPVPEEPTPAPASDSTTPATVDVTPSTASPEPTQPSRSLTANLGKAVLFVVLFGVGVVGSMYIRQYLSRPDDTTAPTVPDVIPTEAPSVVDIAPPVIIDASQEGSPSALPPVAGWQTYDVLNGRTRRPIADLTFQLPPGVAAPICDGASCASMGTYLPGGTRFTIAPRGDGQVLADFRDSLITDLSGQSFTVTETIIAGRNATAFSADFTGATVGGFSFQQMRGVMIEVHDTLSLEVNHFTPSGASVDFAADDLLFDQILLTISFGPQGQEKGGI